MKKSVRKKRTVTELLAVKNKSLIDRIRICRAIPLFTAEAGTLPNDSLPMQRRKASPSGTGKNLQKKNMMIFFLCMMTSRSPIPDGRDMCCSETPSETLYASTTGNILRELRIIKCPAHAGGKTDRRVLVEY